MTLLKTNWEANDSGHINEHNLIGSKLNRIVSLFDYGAVGDGTADDSEAFNDAITAVAAGGGGNIYIPRGVYRCNFDIVPASKVSLFGEGVGNTVIKFYGAAQFLYDGEGTPVTDFVYRDFEIDGTNQNAVMTKGFFFQYCERLFFDRIYIHGTYATGFGCDYMVDSVYRDCIAEGCGRGGTVETNGYSGFGIGTGAYQDETISLINCIARGNKRYGAFFEKQVAKTYFSRGCKIIGGYFGGNQWGIGDCGADGLVISSASVNDNVAEGIYVGGPSTSGAVGINGIIAGCDIARNGAPGIEPAAPETYVLSGNNVHDNGA